MSDAIKKKLRPLRRYRRAAIEVLGSQQGAALILVLWVGSFFSIVLASFAFSMRTELAAAKNFRDREQAQALAAAGLARVIADLANAGSLPEGRGERSPSYESGGSVKLGKGVYQVTVSDETGKISLNAASAPMLRRLLGNNGVADSSLLDTIVDSILDWRDSDDLPHPSGAEAEYYATLPVPYRTRNGPFAIVEELLLVKGMSREILYGNVADKERAAMLRAQNPGERVFGPGEYLGIHAILTVHGSGTVNRDSAGLDALVAAGLSDEEARSAIARREQSAPEGAPLDIFRGNLAGATGRPYKIESTGRVGASSAWYRIAATVMREAGLQKNRFKVIAWYEG